jgi:hypothetical protein
MAIGKNYIHGVLSPEIRPSYKIRLLATEEDEFGATWRDIAASSPEYGYANTR